jgi:hypothetical protein
MTELEKLQEKPRGKRTPLEQCIVDATTFEEAEHDGEIELMEQAAEDLGSAREALKKAKSVFSAQGDPMDLWMAEKYINAALAKLDGKQ